jgi:DNA-binding PucR family transcriptional regulator
MNTHAMLRKLARSPDLAPFAALVEPLVLHDRKRRGDLVRTLRVYFASGANASEAADRLYLHRNSMLYRLARIAELTGLDSKDPRVRLVLELGLLAIDEGDNEDEDEHP